MIHLNTIYFNVKDICRLQAICSTRDLWLFFVKWLLTRHYKTTFSSNCQSPNRQSSDVGNLIKDCFELFVFVFQFVVLSLISHFEESKILSSSWLQITEMCKRARDGYMISRLTTGINQSAAFIKLRQIEVCQS